MGVTARHCSYSTLTDLCLFLTAPCLPPRLQFSSDKHDWAQYAGMLVDVLYMEDTNTFTVVAPRQARGKAGTWAGRQSSIQCGGSPA